jgi:hypothetical protein
VYVYHLYSTEAKSGAQEPVLLFHYFYLNPDTLEMKLIFKTEFLDFYMEELKGSR